MSSILAMILAGGRGERMERLCAKRPKPIMPMAGNLKAIDFCLSNCHHSDIQDIAVLTGYQRSSLASYIKSWAKSNHKLDNITIMDPKNAHYSGTADAVWQNMDFVTKNGFEYIVVLASDHVYKMDYRKLLQAHVDMNAEITIAVAQVPIGDAHRYGIMVTDNDGWIREFQEKPLVPISSLASMGIYVFNRQVLLELLAEDAAAVDSKHDFGYSIIPGVINKRRVFAYKFMDYWRDIGTIESYYQTNMELIDHFHSLTSGNKWPVLSQADIFHGFYSSSNQNIKHSLVSPDCIIRGQIENSVLSNGVIVGENAVVKNSIILSRSSIGEYSHLDGCIVDEDVDIGRRCVISPPGKSSGGTSSINLIGRGYPSMHEQPQGINKVYADNNLDVIIFKTSENNRLAGAH